MLEKIGEKPLPLVTTFYAPSIAADMAGHYHAHCLNDLEAVGRTVVLHHPTSPGRPCWPWSVRTPFHHVTIASPGPPEV